VLVTNAHHKSLMLKLERTALHDHLDHIVCAHDFRVPKEEQAFWDHLQARHPFDPARTLLVDDSLPVLRSARDYGIAHLRAVKRPDSRTPPRDTGEFEAIADFRDIMPGHRDEQRGTRGDDCRDAGGRAKQDSRSNTPSRQRQVTRIEEHLCVAPKRNRAGHNGEACRTRNPALQKPRSVRHHHLRTTRIHFGV